MISENSQLLIEYETNCQELEINYGKKKRSKNKNRPSNLILP